jgi:hypothetical protein
MTKRNPVTSEQNIWFDAQQVDNSDLALEQDYNHTVQSSIINNHIGTGVLPEVLKQNVIFDSILSSGFLDGIAVFAQNQPADRNFGNQLEIELVNSTASGKRNVKLAIIGLDFESNLQYEVFNFKTNEIQVSKKHFTNVLLLLFNDFIGDPGKSFNLGGRLVIREANPMTLSRNPIMISQDVQPNLFFRDFFLDGPLSLHALLQNALPYYNIDTLNIHTSELDNVMLLNNDVTTQIGQKFQASTNNIQKVQLLLSARNLDAGNESDLAWNGDLIISIYELQSNIENPLDIAPTTAIDFQPYNIPIAQISVNYLSLLESGFQLNSIPQPIDFIFSNSPVAGGNTIIPGKYYALTIKRSGTANKCDILIATGNNYTTNARITTFTGNIWVDIPDQDLWFKIFTDAAKISDGQAYDSGFGIAIPKTIQEPISLSTIDYSYDNLQFTGNDVFRAIVAADIEKHTPVPDQRTGNPVFSRKEFTPNIQLLNSIDIVNLQKTSEPLFLGAISDKNKKFYDSLSTVINSKLYSSAFVNDELFIKIVEDPTDTVRFNTDVSGLITNLLNGDLVGAKINPNGLNTSLNYRVASAQLMSCILGDVNGDGQIDEQDLNLLKTFYGMNFNNGLPENTVIVSDGYSTNVTNGYTTYTAPFSNLFGVSFQLVDSDTGMIVVNANDGVLVAHPNDPTLAQFTSSSIQFNNIIGLTSFKLVVLAPFNAENNGIFDIISLDVNSDVITIRKIYLTADTIVNMLRADVDGDFIITNADGYLLESYISKVPLTFSPNNTFPGPSTNPYTKIGTRFNIIRLRLEKYIDRNDDYISSIDRNSELHSIQDIFLNDGYFNQHDFYNHPVPMIITKQLTWDESLIVTNSKPKLVPSIFASNIGCNQTSCMVDGVNISVYGTEPEFDKGKIDVFIPDNIILGNGEIQRADGNFYKVDFEVGTIILEIPDGLFGAEKTINIMDDFIANYTNDGRTRLGFPAMKYADCTFVSANDLAADKVRFSVAVQSFSPNTNGLSTDGYAGIVVDGKIGVSIDYQTGLLTLNFTNLFQDPLLTTLSTKIQIHVYLKKGGFNNKPLFVDSAKVQNMLKLISVFSGAVNGGPSALVDLHSDVSGVLPLLHGGTGLNAAGAFGTVLTSTGSGLNYQFVYDLAGVIAFSSGISDANQVPKTDGYGLLDPSFLYKNPIYIYGSAGVFSNDNIVPSTIGALHFRFDQYILQGLKEIKLEVILETTNASNVSEIRLFNVNTATYIKLSGASQLLTTNNTYSTFISSDDIKSELSAGAIDYIYEIHLSLNPSSGLETAICKMARLVMTYENPYNAMPPMAHSWNFVPYLPPAHPI